MSERAKKKALARQLWTCVCWSRFTPGWQPLPAGLPGTFLPFTVGMARNLPRERCLRETRPSLPASGEAVAARSSPQSRGHPPRSPALASSSLGLRVEVANPAAFRSSKPFPDPETCRKHRQAGRGVTLSKKAQAAVQVCCAYTEHKDPFSWSVFQALVTHSYPPVV